MPRKKQLVASLLIVLGLGATVPKAEAGSVKSWQSIEKLIGIFSNWKGNKSDPSVNRLAAAYIDYDAMAQRSLAAPDWDKLSADQKREYTATLKTLMEQRYYPRWQRIFSKAKVDYVSQSTSAGDVLVKSNMLLGKKTDSLVWRLNERNDKVISLAIGQKDLLNKLKDRLQPKLQKTGFKSLLSWMQAHAKQQASGGDTSSSEAVVGESK